MNSCCPCPPCRQRFLGVVLEAGDVVFSPWTPRRADRVRATLDVIAISGPQITVDLFTKNTRGTGNGNIVDAGTSIVASTTGRVTQAWGPTTGIGLRELVRYRFTIGPTAGLRTNVVFRMLPPVWYNSVYVLPPP